MMGGTDFEFDSMHLRFLKHTNSYEISDEKIRFFDEDHIYQAYSPYFKEWISTKSSGGGPMIVSTTTFLSKFWPQTDFRRLAANVWNKEENRIRMLNDVTYKYFGCKSIKDIENLWKQGRDLGTQMHNHFENCANILEWARKNKDNDGSLMNLYVQRNQNFPEIKHFFEACQQLDILSGNRVFWRTEMLMFNPCLHISGMADGILYDKCTDSYIIIDWKRLKGGLKGDPKIRATPIEKLKPSGKGLHYAPFQQLRKHDENKYGCQLTLYKHLFQGMFPEKRVSAMYLVVVNSSTDELTIHEVPLNKYDACVQCAFFDRAKELMDTFGNDLPLDLQRDLVKYLD